MAPTSSTPTRDRPERRRGAPSSRRSPLLSRWSLFPAALLASLAWLAILPGLSWAPSGTGPGLDLRGFVLPRLVGDAFLVATLCSIAALPRLTLRPPRGRLLANVLFSLLGGAGTALLVVAFADAVIYRYLSERLDLLMAFEYRLVRDPGYVARIIGADLGFFAAGLGGIAAFLLAARALRSERRNARPEPWAVLALLVLACGTFALLVSGLLSAETWRRARPPAWTLVEEALRPAEQGGRPDRYAASIAALRELAGHPPGEYTDRLRPLWHVAPGEAGSIARFRSRPLAEQPDVLLVLFESLRGWEFDFREEGASKRFPRLARLFRERGRQFTAFQSNGFPSVEGWASIHLGLWPHPRYLLLERGYRPFPSLPEALGRAGYWRTIVSPNPWGNVGPWYDSWFDERVLGVRVSDEEMERQVLRSYDAAPPGRPRFLTWVTVSTHPPLLAVPGEDAASDRGNRERYLFAARETDRAIGAILDHVREAGNWDRTVVVVVGDHSTSNGWIALRTPRLGTPNAGETWTGFLWAPPGGPGGVVDTRDASQVDVAPTILGALGLDVSNAFVGRDLLAPSAPGVPAPPAFSLHLGGLAVTRGDVRLHLRLDEPDFLRKFLWNVREPSAEDDGGYRHGEPLPVTQEDRDEAAGLRDLVEAYGYLLGGSHLAPAPGAAATQRR